MATYDIACASHRTNARPEALGKLTSSSSGASQRRFRCGERGPPLPAARTSAFVNTSAYEGSSSTSVSFQVKTFRPRCEWYCYLWARVYATYNFISRFKCIVSEYKHPSPPSKDTRARTDQRLTSSFRLECILRHNGYRSIPIYQAGLTMQKKTDASNASTMCHSSSSTSQRMNDAAKSIPSIMYWFL